MRTKPVQFRTSAMELMGPCTIKLSADYAYTYRKERSIQSVQYVAVTRTFLFPHRDFRGRARLENMHGAGWTEKRTISGDEGVVRVSGWSGTSRRSTKGIWDNVADEVDWHGLIEIVMSTTNT